MAGSHDHRKGSELVGVVVGPTASGKSELGLALAEALGGEIVNADAFQLYRGMDVGTAKLAVAERRGIPHHQLDVLDVTEEASVAAYQRHARSDIAGTGARGRRALLVGGSGLYVRAVLDRIDFPATDPQLRADLEEEAARVGAAEMHARLARTDPAAAAAILPGNVRRVVRALEVVELTGRPFSATLPANRAAVPAVQIGLRLDRHTLDERIARRVRGMWSAGLVEEVRHLQTLGIRRGRTAQRAVGYAQVLAFLDGRCSEEEARVGTVRATRKLARRQESWFRRDDRIVWLDAERPDLVRLALSVVPAAAP